MPEVNIPLAGDMLVRNQSATSFATRGYRFSNVVIDVYENPITKQVASYCSKRSGIVTDATIEASARGLAISDDGIITVMNDTNATVYYGNTPLDCGDISGDIRGSVQRFISGDDDYYIINSANGVYFLAGGSITGAYTFTADRTSGSTTLANVSSFDGLYVGQLLTGTGIAAGARIASMNSGAGTLVMTLAATSGAATSTTVTREVIAKIIDADFPNAIGDVIEIDGYFSVASSSLPRVYTSDLNSIVSWGASSYVSLDSSMGGGCGVTKYRGRMLAFGESGYEFFYNAGNASGSPFSRTTDSGAIGCRTSATFEAVSLYPGRHYYAALDMVVWISPSNTIYMLSSSGARRISPPWVDRIISSSTTQDFDICIVKVWGRDWVYVADHGTFALFYDIKSGAWIENTLTNLIYSGAGSAVTLTDSRCYAITRGTTGKKYSLEFQTVVYTDDTTSYTMTVQLPLDFGTGRSKFISRVGLDSDIQASGTATLALSTDDGQNFTTIGTFDMTQANPWINEPFSFEGKGVIRLTHATSTAFRASKLIFDVEKGAH